MKKEIIRKVKYLLQVVLEKLKEEENFRAYAQIKYSTIASGTTPIGSASRAPDEDENIGSNAGVKIEFIIGGKHQIINSTFHSHREGFATS
jgi:hypothetical protein